MLAGVNASDLEALLEFVYRGEVSVDHSQLPSLLQAAHCLNIQGLAPQTVTKDDYNTTSIQLHPSLLAQHHVKAVIDVRKIIKRKKQILQIFFFRCFKTKFANIDFRNFLLNTERGPNDSYTRLISTTSDDSSSCC